MSDGPSAQHWPGERLGLPEHGPGSLAGWGRRILALVVDWVLSMLVVGAFIGPAIWSGGGAAQWAPLVVFAGQRWVFTSMLGGSVGQVLCRIRLLRLDGQRFEGRRLDPSRALLRTVLLCLVIPPVVYNRDQRGLHDLAAGSVAVRR